ncbi:hypothetical protein V2O64_21170 [Verrucomicrobiaceae bacterium 227]
MKTLLFISLFLASFLITWLIPQHPETAPTEPVTKSLSTRKQSKKNSPQRSAHQEFSRIARLTDPEARLQHLIALANSIPIDQLDTWLTASNLAPLDPSLRSLLLTIACDRWLEAAPADLITWNERSKLVDTSFYLARWLTQDRESFNTYLRDNSSGYTQQYLVPQTIQHLAKLDFNLAFDFAKEQLQPSAGLSYHTTNDILFTLAKQDPDTFRSLAPTLPGYFKNSIAAALISSTLESDFPAAISQLATGDIGLRQLDTTCSMIGNDAFIETVIDNHEHLPDGWLEKLLQGYHFSHSSKTLPLLELTPTELGVSEKAFTNLMFRQQWHDFGLENRPRLFAILNNPDLPLAARKNLLSGQLQYWLKNPSDQLTAQLENLQDPALRDQVLQQHESVEALLQKANPNAGTKLPVHQHLDWTPSQTQEALAIFKNASPTDQRNTLLQIEESSWGNNPNRPYLSEVLATLAAQDQSIDLERKNKDLSLTATFANDWAIDSPSQAAAWVEKLPPGDHRLWAAKNVARTWQLYSPTEAETWINTLSTTEQSAVSTFLNEPAK